MPGDVVGMTESQLWLMKISTSGHASSSCWRRILIEKYKIRGNAWELKGRFCFWSQQWCDIEDCSQGVRCLLPALEWNIGNVLTNWPTDWHSILITIKSSLEYKTFHSHLWSWNHYAHIFITIFPISCDIWLGIFKWLVGVQNFT